MTTRTPEVFTGLWACPRPMTRSWGSGRVFARIVANFGTPDAAFGVRDNIPEGPALIDRAFGFEWSDLSQFPDNHFEFGYWDPPYPLRPAKNRSGERVYKMNMMRTEAREIWRTCRRLAILHEYVYPTAWFQGARREAQVGVTMGPFRRIRTLQVFRKVDP